MGGRGNAVAVRRMSAVGVSVCLLMLGAGAHAQQGVAQRAEELGARIASRVVPVPQGGVDWGEAEGVVEAPFERVVEALRDYARYADFLPHFRRSRVLSRRGSRAMLYLEARILKGAMTLWAQMLVRETRQGPTWTLRARKVRGNMARFEARWDVTPLDAGRRAFVRFRILVDPDLPLPDSLVSEENRKSARRAIRGLRREVRRKMERAARR